jgi:hypothetical protein
METNPTKNLSATPVWERLVHKCWKPDCKKIATGRDGSGWEWCDEHFDQENTGSVLHTKQVDYDFEYYTKRAKDILSQPEAGSKE